MIKIEDLDLIVQEVKQRIPKSTGKDLETWGEVLNILTIERVSSNSRYDRPNLTKEQVIAMRINGE